MDLNYELALERMARLRADAAASRRVVPRVSRRWPFSRVRPVPAADPAEATPAEPERVRAAVGSGAAVDLGAGAGSGAVGSGAVGSGAVLDPAAALLDC